MDMPIAEISGARRKEPRNGRYATRSMAQLTREVNSMAMMSTMNSASANEPMPSQLVKISSAMRAMKADTMNTSPWAKLTMPMMPNTIVQPMARRPEMEPRRVPWVG